MKRIILVGGGSGGHFYPLIAVAEKLHTLKLQGYKLELYYFGPEQYDEVALRENEITFVQCSAGKKRKYFSIRNIVDLFKIARGMYTAIIKLYFIYPDVIFSKGSYTSIPVVIAGFLLRIPIVIHESDARAGSANKFASRFARYIAISFDDAASYFPAEKTALIGIPLRASFFETEANPLAALGLPNTKPLLFVTGGSQGASRLNDLILKSLDKILPAFTVLHQTGTENEKDMEATAASLITDSSLLEHYFVKGTLSANEMSSALSAAAIVVSRAGTGTIFEIAQKGKPSILIPIPETISHDQKTNAYAYARSGAASVLEEHNLTSGLLASEISRIIGDQNVYTAMSNAAATFFKADAAQKLTDTLIGIAQEHA